MSWTTAPAAPARPSAPGWYVTPPEKPADTAQGWVNGIERTHYRVAMPARLGSAASGKAVPKQRMTGRVALAGTGAPTPRTGLRAVLGVAASGGAASVSGYTRLSFVLPSRLGSPTTSHAAIMPAVLTLIASGGVPTRGGTRLPFILPAALTAPDAVAAVMGGQIVLVGAGGAGAESQLPFTIPARLGV